MSQEKIRMPSGMGGLTYYGDQATGSRMKIKPQTAIALMIVMALVVIALHLFL